MLCGLLATLVMLAGCGETPTATPQIILRGPPLTFTAPTFPAGATLPDGTTRTPIPVFPTPLTAAPSPPAGTSVRTDATTVMATATYFAAMYHTMQAATSAASRPTVAPTTAPAVALAPEIAIPGAGKWFNSAPLTLAQLRGKPVLLVFWSDI